MRFLPAMGKKEKRMDVGGGVSGQEREKDRETDRF